MARGFGFALAATLALMIAKDEESLRAWALALEGYLFICVVMLLLVMEVGNACLCLRLLS